ncbi:MULTISPECIES: DeoR/GlpR family DNA-binding transcription regulator [Streptomyces]|uniref:DeoR/GlpR family DNA-binding transcription regulator n=1 Tax=Streptomyces scabiei TaxID=1930 RepID=UPI0004E72363|nr:MULTISPECIES: DeoR/GlpR family DNA-binding transcription regulator [Streptomyces]MBP5863159.1 DeoR/GlpR transcriptional regulator [Streptomyces sp. LBUM 1484]KFG08870.1 D-beta-D-heptose 1-phosphate adenosyltransferase [Streptomyces scabiei]MBP5900117.1 DeoR/GlpR transcriptional regulator [Streptomyces sp. LBUM 1488]MDX2835129.1 DeoR/GlpR family DNA-binding transcription regulator [Streptomyces scabiei]MDX3680170.1 DeoR/GlpR family DNA-binding transcription regulator [Streptomyces scabiei]
MYAPERQQEILRLARDGGRVDVVSLAEQFQVTAETIRRDLKALDRAGLVQRVHGGAIPAGRLDFEPDLAEREGTAADQKDRIAQAALAELPDDGTIVLDAGTTIARLAAAIPLEAALTAVTHSLPIAARLADHPGIQLHLVGGRVRHRTRAAVDAWALRAYGEIRADVLFVAANGFSVDRGLTTPDLAEAAVKRAAVAAARRVVLLADSSKHGQEHFARFGDLTDVDLLITDSGLSVEDALTIERKGTEVLRVPGTDPARGSTSGGSTSGGFHEAGSHEAGSTEGRKDRS